MSKLRKIWKFETGELNLGSGSEANHITVPLVQSTGQAQAPNVENPGQKQLSKNLRKDERMRDEQSPRAPEHSESGPYRQNLLSTKRVPRPPKRPIRTAMSTLHSKTPV